MTLLDDIQINTSTISEARNIPNLGFLQETYQAVSDDNLKEVATEQYKKDSETHRELRQNVYRKIIKIMICELLFIAVLLAFMAILPVIKSFGLVTMHLIRPSIFITSSIFFAYLFYSVGFIPSFRFTCTKLHISKISISSKRFIRATILLLFCLFVSFFPKEDFYLYADRLYFQNDYTGMLVVIETVFVKTTLLLGFIIRGLFKNNNQKNT